MSQRLTPEVFNLPVTEIRRGYRSACYFWRSKRILEAENPQLEVTMQVFQKNHSVLCGIDEAIAILKVGTGYWFDLALAEDLFDEYINNRRLLRYDRPAAYTDYRETMLRLVDIEQRLDDLWVPTWNELEVTALRDGDEIAPWETVMHIKGPLSQFVHLESLYLGVLARGTKVATNVRRVCQATNGKPMLFFADRFDGYENQGRDGYAAKVGGAEGVASDAMAAWWGEQGIGTMPHALIAAYNGETVEATKAFHKHYPDTRLISLVDFNNNCIEDALACADAFGDALWGVRLDTSENMVDKYLTGNTFFPAPEAGDFKPTGVNQQLVRGVRLALDGYDHPNVKIVVSGGFNVEKISAFEAAGVPVDAYAVGSSLLQGSCDFTADVTQPVAKEGRRHRPNSRLYLKVK